MAQSEVESPASIQKMQNDQEQLKGNLPNIPVALPG